MGRHRVPDRDPAAARRRVDLHDTPSAALAVAGAAQKRRQGGAAGDALVAGAGVGISIGRCQPVGLGVHGDGGEFCCPGPGQRHFAAWARPPLSGVGGDKAFAREAALLWGILLGCCRRPRASQPSSAAREDGTRAGWSGRRAHCGVRACPGGATGKACGRRGRHEGGCGAFVNWSSILRRWGRLAGIRPREAPPPNSSHAVPAPVQKQRLRFFPGLKGGRAGCPWSRADGPNSPNPRPRMTDRPGTRGVRGWFARRQGVPALNHEWNRSRGTCVDQSQTDQRKSGISRYPLGAIGIRCSGPL